MKKYEDLTLEQKAIICNGCGGKGGKISPPHAVFFEASCDHHDFGYWKGGTEKDRLICDKGLKKAMRKDCKSLSFLKKLRYVPWCELYYLGVRYKGKKYFYYADTPRDVPDNIEDLT